MAAVSVAAIIEGVERDLSLEWTVLVGLGFAMSTRELDGAGLRFAAHLAEVRAIARDAELLLGAAIRDLGAAAPTSLGAYRALLVMVESAAIRTIDSWDGPREAQGAAGERLAKLVRDLLETGRIVRSVEALP
jgi:hypothetical protein